MLKIRKFLQMFLVLTVTVSAIGFGTFNNMNNNMKVSAATSQIRGVNWADPGDNFQSGVLYVSGLSSSDTYATASTVADRVVGQFQSLLGANTVRMPINEATVSSYWSTYTGAIDEALTKGNVILCYWAYQNGKPASMTAYWSMWQTVITRYGSNSNCYFEPINEPYGYSTTDLRNLYYSWITTYSGVSQSRVILDGTGYAQNAPNIGGDSRLSGCLLGVHDYAFWTTHNSESAWQTDLANEIGSYASRTVMTEWGAGMTTGKNYDAVSTDNEVCYIRGISNLLRGNGMGSCYWPGLRDGDTYGMTTKTGSGASITLSVNNQSGLDRLQYAWGLNYIKIKNTATNMYLDGYGYTSNGSDCNQYSGSSSSNQRWVILGKGGNVMIENVATGMYLDGLGSTSNGANLGQWSGSGSNNQLWTEVQSGSSMVFQNVATGMCIDGLGFTSNGSVCGQWSSSGSNNQKWQIVLS